jgi:hypothetical protein
MFKNPLDDHNRSYKDNRRVGVKIFKFIRNNPDCTAEAVYKIAPSQRREVRGILSTLVTCGLLFSTTEARPSGELDPSEVEPRIRYRVNPEVLQ